MPVIADGLRNARILLATLLFLSLGTAGVSAAEQVPGTGVSLDPPRGFVLSSRFAGFQRSDASSSISVTQVQRPYRQVRAGMNRHDLGRQGMQLLVVTKEMVSGRDARLLYVIQEYKGTTFRRWMLVFGDQARTVMVVASYPQALMDSLDEVMRSSVMSTRWDPA